MRPIRTIAPVALGLVALAVAGCQRPSDPTTTAAPTPTHLERVAPTTTPTHPATPPTRPPTSPAPKPAPDPRSETIVGLWPVKTLAQARELQDGADAGHQPWLLSPEQVSIAYATAELGLFGPFCGAGGSGRLPGPLPPRRVGGHPVPCPACSPHQRRVGRDPGRGPGERVSCNANATRSGSPARAPIPTALANISRASAWPPAIRCWYAVETSR
jgi:hypothetical protein